MRLCARACRHSPPGREESRTVCPQADFLVITKEPSLVHIKDEIAKEVLRHCQTAAGFGGYRKAGRPTCWLFYQWNTSSPRRPTNNRPVTRVHDWRVLRVFRATWQFRVR